MTKTKTLTVLSEAPLMPKFHQRIGIHTRAKMMVLYYHLQLRGKGHWDFVVAVDLFWGGGFAEMSLAC